MRGVSISGKVKIIGSICYTLAVVVIDKLYNTTALPLVPLLTFWVVELNMFWIKLLDHYNFELSTKLNHYLPRLDTMVPLRRKIVEDLFFTTYSSWWIYGAYMSVLMYSMHSYLGIVSRLEILLLTPVVIVLIFWELGQLARPINEEVTVARKIRNKQNALNRKICEGLVVFTSVYLSLKILGFDLYLFVIHLLFV